MEDIAKAIKALNERIDGLEKKVDFYWEQSKKNFTLLDEHGQKDAKHGKRADEILWGEVQRIDKLTKLIVEDSLEMQNRSMLFEQAYYHVFPDRWEQDKKVAKQYRLAISKSGGDDAAEKP